MTQKLAIVGPNIDHGGTFHVHDADCGDLTRNRMYQLTEPETYRWHFDSKDEVIEMTYADQIAEGGLAADYAGDFKFFPCVHLPSERNMAQGAEDLPWVKS